MAVLTAPPPLCPPAPLSGGAGNRTLVRIRIRNRVYVHRLDFLPFRRTGIEPACPEISLACSRHRAVRHREQPARLCDTVGTPQAGFRHRRCVSELSSAYAASASSELAVDTFQTVLPGAWTWARSNSLNEPVEADRPHYISYPDKYNPPAHPVVPSRDLSTRLLFPQPPPPGSGRSASPRTGPRPPGPGGAQDRRWFPGRPPPRMTRSAASAFPATPMPSFPA